MDYEEHDLREPFMSHPVVLLGGFNCHLTDVERNEWAEYLRLTPEYKRLKAMAVELEQLYGLPYDTVNEIKGSLMREGQAIERAIYDIGKMWFGQLVERRREAKESKKAVSK